MTEKPEVVAVLCTDGKSGREVARRAGVPPHGRRTVYGSHWDSRSLEGLRADRVLIEKGIALGGHQRQWLASTKVKYPHLKVEVA